VNFVLDHLAAIIVGLFVFSGLVGIAVGLWLEEVSKDYPPVDEP